jgi:hypothetical protein
VVEGLHPLIDPLPTVLPCLVEPVPVELARVGAKHLAAQPLDRLDLHPLRAAQPAGRRDRAHIALERLRVREVLQLAHLLVGGAGLECLQQRPSRQLGARVGPRKRRAPNLTRTGVQTLEHRLHLLG